MTSNSHSHLPNGHNHQRHPYPPNRQFLPPNPSSSSSSASLKGCCCCLFLLLTFLALLVIAISLIVALVVRPKKPSFDLNQVAVSYLLVSPTQTQTSAFLTLNITLLFTAENPNKVDIRYADSLFSVMYHGVPLGFANVPGFAQPAHSTRSVRTQVTVSRFDVMQADALDLVRDAAVNDRVELRITGDVGARVRVLEITSPTVKVSVDCAIVISPRKQSLTYKQCGVDGVNV